MSDEALKCRLAEGLFKCRQKPKEHQRRALWAREACSQLRPVNDVPDPGDSSVLLPPEAAAVRHNTADSTSVLSSGPLDPRTIPHDDSETVGDGPVIADLIRSSVDPHSPGHRFAGETREIAFELLRTCGRKALGIIRRRIPLPSRQTLCRKPPIGYSRSDLTNPDLIVDRIRQSLRQVAQILGVGSVDPVERQVAQILGRKRVLSADLKSIVSRTCQATEMGFHGVRNLERSTKTEVLDWIAEQWSQFSSALRLLATVNQEAGGMR